MRTPASRVMRMNTSCRQNMDQNPYVKRAPALCTESRVRWCITHRCTAAVQ